MKLIVGLGNPGAQYKDTRHNLGFAVVSALKKTISPGGRWSKEERFKAEIVELKTAGESILLARPLVYMNRNGELVAALAAEEGLLSADIWIIHDDLDLALGTLKITLNSGTGGHKGVESIIQELGTKAFPRFRVGIKPVGGQTLPAEVLVLQKFDRHERQAILRGIDNAVEAVRYAISNGIVAAMNRFNGQPLRPRERGTE